MSKEEIKHLYRIFPNLSRCAPKSKSTIDHNCIAFAAGDTSNVWDPEGYFWPEGAPRGNDLEACIKAFETKGYEICDNPDLEIGFEKVTIWTRGNSWQHAARQAKNGKWLSKLGYNIDIEHELDVLDSTHPEGYGNIACYMKRTRPKRPKRRSRSSGSST